MGSQQILLLVLGIVVVGIALTVGVSMMLGQSTASRKDGMISELQTLGEDARAYYIRPASQGGGGNTYLRYTIPQKLRQTENGIYTCTTTDRRVFFVAKDPTNAANTVTVTLKRFGSSSEDLLTNWSYTGDFQ